MGTVVSVCVYIYIYVYVYVYVYVWQCHKNSGLRTLGKTAAMSPPIVADSFCYFICFDFWETTFSTISAPLVALIELGVSKLVGKLQS